MARACVLTEENSTWVDCDLHEEGCFALRCDNCNNLLRDCEDR